MNKTPKKHLHKCLLHQKLHKLIEDSNDELLLEKLEILLEESKNQFVIPMKIQEEIKRRIEAPDLLFHNAFDVVQEFKEKYSKK